MKFEWDPEKAQNNLLKHGILFEEAQTVFLDFRSIEIFDADITHEDRFIRIGYSYKTRLLTVVFCERDDEHIRIISARGATAEERELYEERLRS